MLNIGTIISMTIIPTNAVKITIIIGSIKLLSLSVPISTGNAIIAKSLNVDSTSTLCIAGVLKVNGNVQSAGSMTNFILSADPSFQTKCTAPSTSTVNIVWGTQLFNNVNYEY
jgi:hypothetical protein